MTLWLSIFGWANVGFLAVNIAYLVFGAVERLGFLYILICINVAAILANWKPMFRRTP